MSKEAYYFSHDSNARNHEKLIAVRMKYKSAGYGVYFMILERLRDCKNYMSVKDYNVIAFDLREDASLIKSVVEDFGLFVFTEDGKYFYSDSFNERMTKKDEIKTQLSIKGIKGNLIKNNHLTKEQVDKMTDEEILFFNEKIKKERVFVAQRSPSDVFSSQRKERKVKESKVKEIKEERGDEPTPPRFVKPTIEDLINYFSKKKLEKKINWTGSQISEKAEKFYNHYESNGWMVGKNKMKNWQACVNSQWIEDKYTMHGNNTTASNNSTGKISTRLEALGTEILD